MTAGNTSDGKRAVAERLLNSVLPLFVATYGGRPDRIGSSVLVRVNGDHFAFTAGHVIRDRRASLLWAAPTNKAKLQPLPALTGFHTPAADNSPNDQDIGILPLQASALGAFAACTFLEGSEIDEVGLPDDRGFSAFYFVLGHPASRSQVKISHQERHIHQTAFHLSTNPPTADAYVREGVNPDERILLDYDQDNTFVDGKIIRPPKLQGVSGGGVFYVSRPTMRGPLVAIATEHWRNSRFIVATRIRYFLIAARQLRASEPPEIFA